MRKESRKYARIDFISVTLYLILVIFGWINIYAAVYNENSGSIFDISQRYGKQMIWIIIAFIIAISVFIINSNVLSQLSYIFYFGILLTLVAVLIFGKEVNGSKSWFEFGGFRIQPSEFAKFATALTISSLLNRDDIKLSKIKSILIVGIIIAVPACLIILQPDTGSALVYLAFIIPLYRKGLTWVIPFLIVLSIILFILSFFQSIFSIFTILILSGYAVFIISTGRYTEALIGFSIQLSFFILGLAVIVLSPIKISLSVILASSLLISSIIFLVWAYKNKIRLVFYTAGILLVSISYTYSVDYIFNNVLQQHQQTRIKVLLGIKEDIKDAGYNVHQSKIAIGSGGLLGKGFLKGTQTKYDFVPEQDTDFIFCTVGEEWGFVGTSTVIILFIILIVRIFYLAEKQRSTFSKIYGYCTGSILFIHVAVNIGMTIGLAPVIGIPLPFFSYGGSSLWSFTILLFIFLKLDTDRELTL